jgi:cysteine desulfurase family protein (TIGR01976 family)
VQTIADTVARMSTVTLDIAGVRRRFSSLGPDFAFFDAPGGTQVPDEVGDAMARALREASGNLGAPYATSRRVAEIVEEAEARSARFLGCAPHEIVFGPNMTSLNFVLTRTASREWVEGDEILSSCLDHDGNVAPWLEAARDRGLVVKQIEVREDSTLDLDDLERKLSDRTKVVAFSWASNAVGTIVDAQRACALAHRAGALAWVDAVHYAAHEPVDVAAIDADVLLCSSYKWCGPHLGIAYVREAIASTWRPYKARPAATTPLGRRFETGTLPYEMLAGLNATYGYLDSIGGFETITPYERALADRFVAGLPDGVRLYGLPSMEGRLPTYLVTVDGHDSGDVARLLADRGYGVWAHDSWYSLGLYRKLGYESTAVRVGIAHYNTQDEVDGLLAELTELAGA